jgi:hypothetical protein
MCPNYRLIVIALLSFVGLVMVPPATFADGKQDKATKSQPTTAELEARARARELGDGDYPLHDLPREVDGDVECPEIELVEYSGEVIPYNRPIEVNKDFRKRLIRFEKMVGELATLVYGRSPARIVHAGGHTCRTVGNRGKKLSEHAFGHAIDVAGFDFEATGEAGEGGGEKVARIATAFSIRLEDHWDATEGFEAKHALFLRLLADELKERGPFSTMLGPAYGGHDTFFHFDFGPQFFFRI